MGKKKKSKKAKKHVLLRKPDTISIGAKLTAWDVFEDYLLPELEANGRRRSTISNVKRAVRRFGEWWSTVCDEPLPVGVIRRRHMEQFREWLGTRGVNVPTQNEACGVLRQLLRCAERHEIIERAPRIERIHHNSTAPKLYFSFDDIERLWGVLDRAHWPRRDSRQEPLHYSPETFWRVALVLYSIYGFRTQELVRLEAGYRALSWGDVYEEALTPNPAGRMECEHGWLRFVPQKQERLKPEPVTNPLTQHTRAAIEAVRPDKIDPDQPVLDVSLSSVAFYHEWHRLVELSGVRPRAGSGVRRYLIKHLRKTATTWLNAHQPGLGAHVVGHAADRSGQEVSKISERHYANNEEAVCGGLASFVPPACYEEILGVCA